MEDTGRIGFRTKAFLSLLNLSEWLGNFHRSRVGPGIPPLLSIHLPKTGGTTFRQVLREIYGRDLYCYYRPQSPMTSKHLLPGAGSDRNPADFRCIHGHFDSTVFSGRFPDARYVYWLRDPVERIISLYAMRRRVLNPNADNAKVFQGQLTLEDYATLPANRNVYTRVLKGVSPENTFFVGFTEEFSAGLDHFYEKLGLPGRKNPPKKRNTSPVKLHVDSDTRARLRELNAADVGLYEAARSAHTNSPASAR